mgnify:FL=1
MALNIKNEEVERLVEEVARLAGENKTTAVKVALAERRVRLALRVSEIDRETRLRRFLEVDVWPRAPAEQLGKTLTRQEEDAILGYGPEGV